jgi:hypothetical protein
MKKSILLFAVVLATMAACSKSSSTPGGTDGPKTTIPAEVTGNWMYGNFSMTEYWSQDPSEYLGNGLELAFAFTFNGNGTYTQYFTASSVMSGVVTYQQSVTQGTMEVDAVTKKIITHPSKAHYKRTVSGQVAEERDLTKTELGGASTYYYTTGNETNGTPALYLTLEGTPDPFTFLKKD